MARHPTCAVPDDPASLTARRDAFLAWDRRNGGMLGDAGRTKELAAQIHKALCGALIRRGLPLLREKFHCPAPPQHHEQIGEGACGVPLHLFGADPRNRSEVIMAAALGVERGIVRCHLDRLKEANFVAEVVGTLTGI
jgi:hypothetical protein